MVIEFFNLSKTQKILYYSAMIAIIAQSLCIYYFIENKNKFNMKNCFLYLLFSALAYVFYFKLVIP